MLYIIKDMFHNKAIKMKKYIFLLLFFSITILFSGCNKNKALIFFSANPITIETFSMDKVETTFQEGQKIYFVLFNPKPFTSDILRIQVLKIDRKAPYYGFTIAHARDIEIDKTLNYATDYFCIHQEGYYILRIFSKDKLERPIAEADFEISSL
ncbi:MAG: hypothetical protein A2255_04440 [Candidatus Melainabacteria bacterium RIFOXYA2_FULL_32_9]|nr:MAG: hypothetical protein A2255_04440 [Candidatus Melainabacteria bacterium RIFOXYA2_FULL_32_9]